MTLAILAGIDIQSDTASIGSDRSLFEKMLFQSSRVFSILSPRVFVSPNRLSIAHPFYKCSGRDVLGDWKPQSKARPL